MSDATRLGEIQEEMIALFEEAKDLILSTEYLSRFQKDRAKAYWMGHIQNWLVEPVDLGGGATMTETVTSYEDIVTDEERSSDEDNDDYDDSDNDSRRPWRSG